jgi:hypothetical protein
VFFTQFPHCCLGSYLGSQAEHLSNLHQKFFKYVSELQVGEEVERALANFAPPKVGFRYNA